MAVSLSLIALMPLFFGFVVNKEVQLHFGPTDTNISPQQPLKKKMGMEESDFVEYMPPGHLTFGDTVLTQKQKDLVFDYAPGKVNQLSLRWNNARIPYVIDCSLDKLKDAVSAIKDAMKEWQSKTCIKFVERKRETKYLTFFRNTQCWSHVGSHENTYISVGYGCEYTNVLMHQIGHAIGLYHVHNRKDRDDNIDYMQSNVKSSFEDVFLKAKKEYSNGVKYDLSSIMHYPWNAYSAGEDRNTLFYRPFDDVSNPPYKTISATDIKQVSELYSCDVRGRKKRSYRNQREVLRPPPDDDIMTFSVVSVPKGTPGCVDWDVNCDLYVGACKIKADLRNKCKRSCGEPVCFEFGPCDTADKNAKCGQWANSRGKYCTNVNYKKYMTKNCCQTCKEYTKSEKVKQCKAITKDCNSNGDQDREWCKVCKGKKKCEPGCKDVRDDCDRMKSQCEGRAKGFMKRNCCATCACAGKPKKKSITTTTTLPTTTEAPPKPIPICTDTNTKDCKKWAADGYCETFEPVRTVQCCKTCKEKGTPTKKKGPGEGVTRLRNVKRKFLGTGRLCDRNRGITQDCDKPGLKPDGICTNPLGLAYDGTSRRKISDRAFSSARGYLKAGGWSANPENARLYLEDDPEKRKIGGWCADTDKITSSQLQSITVNLGSLKRITHIATQGRDKYYERISQFKIEYSGDGNNFLPYKENGKLKIFDGNCDHQTPVVNEFIDPVFAQYIKYIPWKFNYPCVRMELYGCNINDKQPDP